jgi:hypothetical protein
MTQENAKAVVADFAKRRHNSQHSHLTVSHALSVLTGTLRNLTWNELHDQCSSLVKELDNEPMENALRIVRDAAKQGRCIHSFETVSNAIDLVAGSEQRVQWYETTAKCRELLERLDKESSADSKPDLKTNDSSFVKENAGRIFAAFLSNPSVVQSHGTDEFLLVGTELDLAKWAWRCARELERAQFTEQQSKQ